MASFLLPTKVRIPPQPHRALLRPRLLEALRDGVGRARLTLLSAPAGYGKTTLLAQWAHASPHPVAWLSIEQEDNDLERFLRYLLAAWEEVQPGVRRSPFGLLLSGMSPDSQAALAAFISLANAIPGKLVFVLDDYHLIEEPSIHTAVTFLLDHLPSPPHFILAGRGVPPLPLARYRARLELAELGAGALSFQPGETEAFLEKAGLALTRDEVERLQARLEGWAAGLQLVRLSLQQRLTGADKLLVGGSHRFIADYLDEDVLAALPEPQRRFLLQTSILERLCGPLCDAVTGQADGQEMLEALERDGLFVVPLDDSRHWFRYHRLFADFLQETLQRRHPADVAGLRHRAAGWYLAQEMPEQAFRHAVAAGDVGLVVEIARRYVFARLMAGEIRLVKQWLGSLPGAWYADRPELGFFQAAFLYFTGQFDACARYLDELEQQALRSDEAGRRQLAGVTAMRCFIACFQNDLEQAESYADQALPELPEEDDFGFRAGIYGALGDTYRRHGRWAEAKACYLKVLDFSGAPMFRVESVHLFGALADLALRQGSLKEAAGYWQKARAGIEEQASWGSYPLPVTGWVYIRLAEILYEWNDLERAGRRLTEGLERVELGGDVRARIAGYLLASRLQLAGGNVKAAGEYLERAEPLVGEAPFPDWTGRFERCRLELWLAEGQLDTAVAWADTLLQTREQPEIEVAHLAAGRTLIAGGDGPRLNRALSLLERLLPAAEAEGRAGIQIEALALQALAQERLGDEAAAMITLERALRLAEPEDYVRLFADLGLPMARLLQEAYGRGIMPAYVDRLLAACDRTANRSAAGWGSVPEPLTPREQEVLRLLAAGLTNREIAAQLVVSPETVKKHAGNIYIKLGVRNRTEAVTRARALDLLT